MSEKLKIKPLKLKGTFLIESNSFKDHRGVFARFFCQNEMKEVVGERQIMNVNFSKTIREGSFRGLHYQKPPFAEMKMVRCIRGNVKDFFVDIRADSETFLKWDSVELSADEMNMVVIPEGFAHGFQALEDNSEIIYLTSQFYSAEHEGALNVNDPELAIELPLKISDISDKDKNHPFVDDQFAF